MPTICPINTGTGPDGVTVGAGCGATSIKTLVWCLEAFLGDLVATLCAAPVRTACEPSHGVGDAAKHLGAHFDQRETDVMLEVCI